MTRTKENLLTIVVLIGILVLYGFMGDDDYHKRFDKPMIIRYDCRMLIDGWHPDVPTEVIDACRKQNNERNINVKNY